MAENLSLFGKNFDQQVAIAGDEITKADISPNRRIPGEIIFEPMGPGVRVTARDDQHRVLWGYVGSKETTNQIHCLVATYETLQDLIGEELEKLGSSLPEEKDDPIARANSALTRLESTVEWLRKSMDVKKVSGATLERARTIARIASDVDRQITLDAANLKGMKSKASQE